MNVVKEGVLKAKPKLWRERKRRMAAKGMLHHLLLKVAKIDPRHEVTLVSCRIHVAVIVLQGNRLATIRSG